MSRLIACSVIAIFIFPIAAFGSLTIPSSINAEAEGPAGARVGFTIQVVGGNDGSDGRPADTVTCSPSSGSIFPIGTTTVSCTGSEGSTGSFPVIVTDSTAPALSVPFDYSIVTTSPSGEAVTFTTTATDLVDGSVPVTCNPPSGSTFPLGTTSVTCTASDSRGNSGSAGFNLTLVTSPPPPGNPDLVAEATSPDGARVTFNTSDSEDDDGRPGSGGCSPAPGTTFPLGETTVVCPSGNFTVSVVDTTPPSLSLPANITAVATGPSGAAVTFTATASDLVDGSVSVVCTPPSGSTFALGTATVNCSASDSRGNTSTGSFQVEITSEPTPPTNPDDITAEATGPGGAVVTFDLGLDGDARPITCQPASGSTFPLGATAVTCSSGATFTVTVIDTTPPSLTLPANITREATSPSGATATFSASATDLVDGSIGVTCTPPSGSTFALGTTTVTCTATDANHNTINGTFSVTVVDTTPPVLTLPSNMTIEATSPAGAVATFSATASDLVDGTVGVTCTPPSGSTFALGTTTVSCSANDSRGNSSSGAFTVSVVDTTPPEITSVTVSPNSIWPPNKKMVAVAVTINVEDIADPVPLTRIFDITCDETIGSGDAQITGLLTAELRADRDAKGNGRVYTLHVEAIDASGNRSTVTVTVTVPHDESSSSTTKVPSKRRAAGGG